MEVNIKTAIDELHRAFHLFNEAKFDNMLPEPAILIQQRGNKKNINGWCSSNKIWLNSVTEETRYEINIVAESLNRTLYQIMGTLIHEMVHLHNLVNDIKDVSRNGTYHNKMFKIIAESVGLIIEHDKRLGWSLTYLQDSTIELIKSFNIRKRHLVCLGMSHLPVRQKPAQASQDLQVESIIALGAIQLLEPLKRLILFVGIVKYLLKKKKHHKSKIYDVFFIFLSLT